MKIPHNLAMMNLMICTSLMLLIRNSILLAYQYHVVNKFVSKNIYLNDGEC